MGASFSPGSANRHGMWWCGRRPTPEWRRVLMWVPSTWCLGSSTIRRVLLVARSRRSGVPWTRSGQRRRQRMWTPVVPAMLVTSRSRLTPRRSWSWPCGKRSVAVIVVSEPDTSSLASSATRGLPALAFYSSRGSAGRRSRRGSRRNDAATPGACVRPSSRQCRLGWLVRVEADGDRALAGQGFPALNRSSGAGVLGSIAGPIRSWRGTGPAQDRTRVFATRNSEASDWLSAGHGGVSPFGHVASIPHEQLKTGARLLSFVSPARLEVVLPKGTLKPAPTPAPSCRRRRSRPGCPGYLSGSGRFGPMSLRGTRRSDTERIQCP